MNLSELNRAFVELGLTQSRAATLLSVDERTVRRWFKNPSRIPGAAEQALKAWVRLKNLHLSWEPGDQPIGEDAEEWAEQIALYRRHAIQLDMVLQQVRSRGGPKTPWKVDLKRNEATLGHMRVSFHRLVNGGFSPFSYSRSDQLPNSVEDNPLLEDAFACIANAIARERRDVSCR